MEEENKKEINCSVVGCNYNDEKGKCTLSNIQIGCTTNNKNCNNTLDTICNSFCPSINVDYEMAEEIVDFLNH
ncbi:MAG: DUF1540 domain-containing protein [Bacilli bacterium]|nr:DUF1540 domain-containing protein [Bacilli bacterium]